MPQNMPTSLIPLTQNAIQGSLLPDTLNCLMNHSSSGKWMSYNCLHLKNRNVFQSWSVCFHTGLKLSLADKPLPLLRLKFFWKRVSSSSELLLNFIVIEKTIVLNNISTSLCYLVCFTTTTLCLQPLISGLVKLTALLKLYWQNSQRLSKQFEQNFSVDSSKSQIHTFWSP